MAAAHFACVCARIKKRSAVRAQVFHACQQYIAARISGKKALPHSGFVHREHVRQSLCAARVRLSFCMHGGDRLRQCFHMRERQGAVFRHVIEQAVFIKALHFNDAIDKLSRPVKRQSIRLARDAAHGDVKLWRRRTIKLQLARARIAAQFCGAEIEVGLDDCALEFEDALACKKHP